MIKIGINGFGRIGRLVMRIVSERPQEFELCGINLRNADIEYMVYMTKYDSVFGGFEGKVEAGEGCLIINGRKVPVFSETDPGNIPWASCGAEYIVESTGAFNTTEKSMAHILRGGAKKVILTAPAKDSETPMFVMGVNHKDYTADMNVISNASCTTNCLAPLAKVLNDAFGIEKGLMTTIHAATAKQKTVDARVGSDHRAGRSILENIIPSQTGAAKAVGKVLPELNGKLTGMAFRVPTKDVSVVDLTVEFKRDVTYEEICKVIKDASEGEMNGIIAYTADDVVSCDMRGETHTCIFDEKAGIMLDSRFFKIVAWYDNEWGYSNKVVDLLQHAALVDRASESAIEAIA